MADTKPTAPLDLSLFDNLDSSSAQALTVPSVAKLPATADPRLAPETRPERLVEIANLDQGDLAAAQASAAKVDFRAIPRRFFPMVKVCWRAVPRRPVNC
jgi:hypothetical protein